MCLRIQLREAKSNVKVIEVFPPAVQSKSFFIAHFRLQIYCDE